MTDQVGLGRRHGGRQSCFLTGREVFGSSSLSQMTTPWNTQGLEVRLYVGIKCPWILTKRDFRPLDSITQSVPTYVCDSITVMVATFTPNCPKTLQSDTLLRVQLYTVP